uniref:Transposase IS701-like DDE domain-containing protein n=1 Tax=uncultured Desulfobacterium sp. TaxID=201089 RepID=E1Y9T7_9BACT|nr:hypothetical protein N47_H21530 [uncultured Desulfobacterium sp.]
MSSNVLRSIQTLFGFHVNQRRFYTFMASNKLPWNKLWLTLWSMIPEPLTDGRLLIALDDFINAKTGKKIFGCATHLRSCRQDQPVQISLGAKCGAGRRPETRQRALGMFAPCLPILSAPKSHQGAIGKYEGSRQGTLIPNQTGASC